MVRRAMQQRHAEHLFERRHLARDRGGGDLKLARRRRKTSQFDDAQQRAHRAQVIEANFFCFFRRHACVAPVAKPFSKLRLNAFFCNN
jgi:hypothetical protein